MENRLHKSQREIAEFQRPGTSLENSGRQRFFPGKRMGINSHLPGTSTGMIGRMLPLMIGVEWFGSSSFFTGHLFS
ncbi:hypothetical protein [Larkinella sp. C7]|uniref:hypothetical protein n=1 Tax=Larkinella sp. C7 TaxID=2576607 RepID=UPI00111150E5|nr:hypothetical protein [Larkinella sp. C7]